MHNPIPARFKKLFSKPYNADEYESHEAKMNRLYDSHQQTFIERNNLPCLALMKIYRLSEYNIEFNMPKPCKPWLQVCPTSSPCRQKHFLINGVDDMLAFYFIREAKSDLRHVSIDCAAAGSVNVMDDCSKSATILTVVIEELIYVNNTALETLEIANMVRLTHYFRQFYTISRLLELIAIQTNLRVLSLINSGFVTDHCVQLLAAACEKSRETLERVELVEYLIPAEELDDVETFVGSIRTLTNLTELSVGYVFVTGDLLDVLSSLTPGKLKLLKIWISQIWQHGRASKEAWKSFVTKCPNLKADVIMWDRNEFFPLYHMLTKNMPLRYLYYNCGDKMPFAFFVGLLHHLMNSFLYTLEELHVVTNLNKDNSLISQMVKRSINLEILTIEIRQFDETSITNLIKEVRAAIKEQPYSVLKCFMINKVNIDLVDSFQTRFKEWVW